MNVYETVSAFYTQVSVKKEIIGKSLLGRSIYAVKVGNGSPCGIVQCALHGREYITVKLALEQYAVGVAKGSCWFIPLANPDGALLSEVGVSSVSDDKRRADLLKMNGNEDFSLWKANARGVDLNVNFDACWGMGAKNLLTPGRENCIGERPFSEPESVSLANFTKRINPDYTVSYHTKGEEIYWHFFQSTHICRRDFALARRLSCLTGYSLCEAKGSVGGYKDWCISKLRIPAFTVEVGEDFRSHPLKEDALEDILRKNKFSIYELSKEIECGN